MDYFTEEFGFESDDLELVAEELARVLNMRPEHRFSDSFGGDISSFGKRGAPGGRLILYYNHSRDTSGPYVNEGNFPEFGLILNIEQEGDYVDYEPMLHQMVGHMPILIERRRWLESKGKREILFDLGKARSKS